MYEAKIPEKIISAIVDVAFKATAEGLSDEEVIRIVMEERRRLLSTEP